MAKATVAIIAVTSPTRNSITTGMMKQKEGSVCSVSMIGVTKAANRSLRDAKNADRNADERGDERRYAAQIERRHGLLPKPRDGAERGQDRDQHGQPHAAQPIAGEPPAAAPRRATGMSSQKSRIGFRK